MYKVITQDEYERERAFGAERVIQVEAEVDRLRRECDEIGRKAEEDRQRQAKEVHDMLEKR